MTDSRICFVVSFAFSLLTANFNGVNAQARTKSEAELKLEEQVATATLEQQLEQAKLAAAKARQDAVDLSASAATSAQAQAAAQKAIAVAEKDAALARREMYKGPDVAGSTGKITATDGAFIENRMLAQQTLATTLSGFVTDFAQSPAAKGKAELTLVIYNPADMPALELYAAVRDQLGELIKKYKEVNEQAEGLLQEVDDASRAARFSLGGDPMLIAAAASGIVRSAADLVSLFRTTTDFKNFDLPVEETLLVASLTQTIHQQQKKWKVYYPIAFPLNTFNLDSPDSDLLTQLGKLGQVNTTALANIDKLGKKAEGIAAIGDKVPYTRSIAVLQSLNDSYAQLRAMLNASDPTSAVTAQTMLLRAERLGQLFVQDGTYFIKATATSKGSNRVTENLWRNAHISFSAGTELNCLVFDHSGQVIFAQSRCMYTPYTDADDINRILVPQSRKKLFSRN